MNKRLQAIEALVRPGRGLIDVGTDHGYLPVSLARHGYPGALFASDLREGPLNAARRSAREAGLSERITFQLCDGLELCDPDAVDTIVIAGMGGDTVCGILDRAEWCLDPRYRLILQPMTRAEVLRYWLTNNGFVIEEERLVEDAGEIYALLSARFGGEMRLSDAELYTGAFDLVEGERLWPEFPAPAAQADGEAPRRPAAERPGAGTAAADAEDPPGIEGEGRPCPAYQEIFEPLCLWAPPEPQMDFDNSGFLLGHGERPVTRVLLALDITDAGDPGGGGLGRGADRVPPPADLSTRSGRSPRRGGRKALRLRRRASRPSACTPTWTSPRAASTTC